MLPLTTSLGCLLCCQATLLFERFEPSPQQLLAILIRLCKAASRRCVGQLLDEVLLRRFGQVQHAQHHGQARAAVSALRSSDFAPLRMDDGQLTG